MDELIIEGLDTNDFIVLEKVLKRFKVSIDDDIPYFIVESLYKKVKQIVDYLDE